MAAAALRSELRAFAAAVTLLTRVPIGRRIAVNELDIARSLAWLPLVGLALGAVVSLGLLAYLVYALIRPERF